ncbi:MAG: ABC transporter permease [Bacteroidota bacterium]
MNQFDIDAAVTTWRRFLSTEIAISDEDAEELEGHLRDHFDDLIAQGLTPRRAFDHAVRKLGSYALIKQDYKDVYWKKARAEGRIFKALRANLAMLKNYFRVSVRYIKRHPGYTGINVTGLALGLAGCLLISMYVWHELSFDRFHDQADNIYRVVQQTDSGSSAKTGGGHAALVNQNVPGTEATVRLAPWKRNITVTNQITSEQAVYAEQDFLYADPSFFDVFSFQLISGDPASVLSEPGTVVVTEDIARKYFGDASPLGQVILMYDGYSEIKQLPLIVTGVVANPPAQSHIPLSVIASTATLEQQYGPLNNLNWPGLYTYVLLPGIQDIQEAAHKATTALAGRLESDEIQLGFQPLTEVYLHPQDRGEPGVGGSITLVYGLSGMALIVLLLAYSNFTNLALARATTRIKELGVHRAIGASRLQLAAQFLADAFLLTSIAVVIALGFVWAGKSILVPFASDALFDYWGTGTLWLFVAIILLTSLLAGAYPAILAARQRPAETLRGLAAFGKSRLRSTLIVFQFASCIVLIAGSLVIHQQVDYLQSIRLGFDEEQVVTIRANKARRNYQVLSQALASQPGVLAVSGTSGLPGLKEVRPSMVVQADGERTSAIPIETHGVGPGFFELLDIPLVAGHMPAFSNNSEEVPAGFSQIPEEQVLINETAAAALGWRPEDAIEQSVRIVDPGNEANNPGIKGRIAGVVADFHHSSARTPITSFAYYAAQSSDVANLFVISHVLVKLAPGNRAEQIKQLKAAWHQVLPDQPFEIAFLDDQIQAQYAADVRLGRAIGLFAGLAILIAAMGLFGLASFMTQRRTKEVGIRKVLGASETSMLFLLTGRLFKLVSIAFIIATPLAYFGLKRWVEAFAYRIELGAGIFLLIGLIVLVVALVAVSYQTIKVARGNPVDALRYE